MSNFVTFTVDNNGHTGLPLNGHGQVLARLEDGRQVAIPAALFAEQEVSFGGDEADLDSQAHKDNVTIPVVEETVSVHKRTVETGKVRVSKEVTEREEVIDEPLFKGEVDVTRTIVDRVQSELPETRYEGDTIIIPVAEEVLVVEKRYLLKEEVRVSKRLVETREPRPVTLKSEHVTIERVASSS